MLDVLQFEGQLARFSLRRWSADARLANARAERVRYRDEQEALTVLRGLIDGHSLRRLKGFLVELGAPSASLSDEPLELLWMVARRIVSGELVLEREPIVPIASEPVEKVERVHLEPHRNEISEASGFFKKSLAQAQQATTEQLLRQQAKQAEALRTASATGVPFCEVCAGLSSRTSASSIADEPTLTTQAKQAEALRSASASGVGFCEVCASCHAEQPKPTVTTAPDPPPSVLASQAKQAEALRAASANGTPFCAHCNC
jgi:hypothetical protein